MQRGAEDGAFIRYPVGISWGSSGEHRLGNVVVESDAALAQARRSSDLYDALMYAIAAERHPRPRINPQAEINQIRSQDELTFTDWIQGTVWPTIRRANAE